VSIGLTLRLVAQIDSLCVGRLEIPCSPDFVENFDSVSSTWRHAVEVAASGLYC
jgi:hypothetical protein